MKAAVAAVAIAAGAALSSPAVQAKPETTPAGVFLPYQVAWILDEGPVAIWETSRRNGADWTEAFRVVRERMSGARTCDYWYSSADESAAAEFVRYAQTWAVELYGAVLEIVEGVEQFEGRDVKTMSIQLPDVNGRRPRITAMASSPKAFRSKGGDVGISELAFHQHAAELWKAAVPVTMWGGRIRVISTHHGVKSKFNELLGQARNTAAGGGRPTDLRASVHRTTIHDAVEQGLVERINQVTGQSLTREEFIEREQAKCGDATVWAEEYECRPSEEASSYFPFDLLRPSAAPAVVTDNPDIFIAAVIAAAMADGVECLYAGADIGRVSDLFAVWVLAKRGGMRTTAAVLGMRGASFEMMEAVFHRLMALGVGGGRVTVRRLCIDATGLGMQIAERMGTRYRTRVEGVKVTATVKEDLVTTFRRDVEERTITVPDELGVLAELNSFRKEVTTAGNIRYVADDSREGHADRAFAGFLATHAAKRTGPRMRPVVIAGGAM
jgi:phage FluMu gp28-like protein